MNEVPVAKSNQLKILIVDDRAENIASLRQVLAQDDLQIVEALSGNDALNMMLDHDFALVLLDVQMPGMDGFEVAELMRQHEKTRGVPIIFVTAINKERRHQCSGYEAGAIDYLFKPIDPFIIRAKVGAFLELKRSQLAREQLVWDLNRANRRLQEISDLKSDYLSAASHELRTPLTVIKEFCSLVHDEIVGPINEEQKKCLGSAVRNCNRLASLVNDLLDLDSIESGNCHLSRFEVDPGELLRSCYEDFRARCDGADQTLRLEPSGLAALETENELPAVLGAPDMITQVLVNLVGNAHKFTPAGGEIIIRAARQGNDLVVEVQDDGPGISVEDQGRVFEKFAQLNRCDGPGAKGTGLGLPISRKIIELHGGNLDLITEPGRGSCFRFNLPLYSHQSHLRAFVGDGTHNPIGLLVNWTLILIDPVAASPDDFAAMGWEIQCLVRSSEDRTGRVVVGGRSMHAVLLKADMTGADSFLDRLRTVLAEKFPTVDEVRQALLNVSPQGEGDSLGNLDAIRLTPLDLNLNPHRKGVLNV